jgi:prolyl 4-hydroxylase
MTSETHPPMRLTARAIEDAAHRGDPVAQVYLAQQLAADGRRDESVMWLERAAKAGQPYAFALLGTWQVLGHNVPLEVGQGLRRLELAAQYGEDTAAAFLAVAWASGLAGAADWARAFDWLFAAARAGNARSLAQIGLLLEEPQRSRWRGPLLTAAARGGFGGAVRVLQFEGSPVPAAAGEDPPWDALRESIQLDSWLERDFEGRSEFSEPLVRTFRRVLDASLCQYVIGVAQPFMERAAVNEPHRGRSISEMRTNSYTTLGPANSDPLLQLVSERIARLCGAPVSHQEDASVLRYRPGEIYENHYDFYNPDAPQFLAEIREHGQREMTALIYLSSEFEAGETSFPELDWKFRGAPGDAIVWSNVRADGSPEPRSQHAGLAPTRGEKWVLSKWIRSQPQKR